LADCTLWETDRPISASCYLPKHRSEKNTWRSSGKKVSAFQKENAPTPSLHRESMRVPMEC
jgi:hypothetical protein